MHESADSMNAMHGRLRRLRRLRWPRNPGRLRRLQLSASLPHNGFKTRGRAHCAFSQRRDTPTLIHHRGKEIQHKKQSNRQPNIPVSSLIHHPGSATSPSTPSISDNVAMPGPESGQRIATGNWQPNAAQEMTPRTGPKKEGPKNRAQILGIIFVPTGRSQTV